MDAAPDLEPDDPAATDAPADSAADSERLTELYRGVAVHATEDAEHKAALELLSLVMLADSHLGDDELDVIRELTEDWRGDTFSYDQYLGPAMARAREARRSGDVADLLDDIDARISSRVLRLALFSAAREISGVDGEINPDEDELLAQIAVRFG